MDFPINQTLLEETTKLKEERRLLRERIAKVEETRAQVSDSVYQRVRTDYERKFKAASNALLSKKGEIDRELLTLYAARTKVSANVQEHQDQLEELRFRHSLGEFAKEGFETQAGQVTERLTKFETLLTAVNTNIARYEALFADETDLLPEGPATVRAAADRAGAATTPAGVPAEAGDMPTVRDDTVHDEPPSYALDTSEGDYFGGVPAPQPGGSTSTPAPSLTHPSPTAAPVSQPPAKPQTLETRVFRPSDLEANTQPGLVADLSNAPTLAVVEGALKGSVFPLRPDTTIGRSTTNAIALKDTKVSRQHAIVHCYGDHWTLEDLQSANGVYVNGSKITEVALQPGDKIQIGDFVLEFRK